LTNSFQWIRGLDIMWFYIYCVVNNEEDGEYKKLEVRL
jgi:hypothetical protein